MGAGIPAVRVYDMLRHAGIPGQRVNIRKMESAVILKIVHRSGSRGESLCSSRMCSIFAGLPNQ